MSPVTELPQTYRRQSTFNLSRNTLRVVSLSMLGLVILFTAIWSLIHLTLFLRPDSAALLTPQDFFKVLPKGGWIINIPPTWIVAALLSIPLVIIIRQVIQGLFFWLFTKKRSRFGLKGFLVYTAAPRGYYLRRNQYSTVSLAPLLILSCIGALLLPFAPVGMLATLICFLSFNICSSVGDMAVSLWILQKPVNTLIEDKGVAMIAYTARN